LSIGLVTLAELASETISDSDTKQHLLWPPWAMQQEIEKILSLLHHSRWPRQVLFSVAVAGIIVHTLPMET
jgi:hypothetical protein